MDQKFTPSKWPAKLLLFALVTCSAWLNPAKAQVDVTATAGTPAASYTNLSSAFTAINAGTHQGAIVVNISASFTDVSSAVLNSSGAGTASYTSVLVQPSVDGVTISYASVVGRGVIELNGADNVTIDGDNPNTGGINRNLTITNTAANTIAYTSVIRIATSTVVSSADNNTVRNCNINGSATGRNTAGTNSTTGSENTTFGIIAAGNAGATLATDAPAALTSVPGNAAPTATTINTLLVDNNMINQCARGITFNGTAAAQSTGVTVTNNLVGDQSALAGAFPFTAPATTVYVKGIYISGTTAITITGNSVRNIISYVGTPIIGIELNSAIGAGTINISNNTVNGVVLNAASGNAARGISVSSAGAPYTIAGNTISTVMNSCNSTTITTQPNGLFVNTAATSALIEKNRISTVIDQNIGTFGVAGVFLNGGNNITFSNNFVYDVNQSIAGGAAFTNATWGIFGMRVSAGTGHKIYNNTISLSGAMIGSSSSILNAAFTIANTGTTGMDVRNNIFSNTMTGGTTSIAVVSMFLPSGATSAMNLTLNNNVYYTASTASVHGVAQVGFTFGTGFYTAANFNAAATTPANNLRAYSSTLSALGTNDNLSFASSVAAPFISATNLHINNVALNAVDLDAKAASVAGVTTDIDGDVRNVTTPDVGADEFNLPGCVTATGGSVTPATATRCQGQTYSMTATGATIGTGITYQWEVSTTGGGVGFGNVTGGTGATTTAYTTAALPAGTYYYRLNTTCTLTPVTGYSNEVMVTVNPAPAVMVTPTTATICNPGGSPAGLTATGAVTYSWSPAAGLSANTGDVITANPSATTVYTVTGTDGIGCTATATTTITIVATPEAPVVTPAAPAICSGGSIALNAVSTYLTPMANVLGSGVLVTILSSTGADHVPNPFAHYYGGNKHQMLILASELTALGMTPGSVISSIGLPVAAVNTTEALQSFLVRMGHSSLPAITAFQTGLTDVRTAGAYNPVTTPGVSTVAFTTPFTWNGTDNIVLETSFSNNDSPLAGNVTMTYGTTPFQSCIVYRNDNIIPATMNSHTGTVNFTLSARPNITFNFANVTTVPGADISWSPATGLSATTGSSVTANPATTSTYTLTAVNGICTSAPAMVTVSVGDPLICTGITPPAGSVCANTDFNLTLNTTGGGSPFSYAWSDGTATVYPDAASITPNLPAGTYNFTVTVTDDCSNTCMSNITVVVNANGGTITGPTSGLTYQPQTYVASGYAPGSTFQWQSGTTSGGPYTNISGATNDTLVVTSNATNTTHYVCVITSPGTCITMSNQITTVITLAGDNVCSAVVLNPGLNGPFTNVGATTETGEAIPALGACTGQATWCSASGGISNTVWFSFVAPASGKASIHFVPGNWDSEIALWSAPACGDLLTGGGTMIAANDDSTGSSPWNAYIAATCLIPGNTYYVQVDGYGTTTNNNFQLFLKTQTNTAPVIAGTPSDMTVSNDAGSCGAAVTWTAPTVSDADNCIASLSSFTSTHNSGDVFPIGTTTVTYTAMDGANTVTSSFDVTVNDTELPVISGMPTDITMLQNNTGCTGIVTWSMPSASDNCATPSLTASHTSGDVFPLGTTVVTYTSLDVNGNTATASFNVTITSDLASSLTSSTDVLCNGGTEGAIDAAVAGTGTPFIYDWDNDGTGDTDDSEDLSTLTAGVYTLVVTDANSCSDTLVVTITEPAAINVGTSTAGLTITANSATGTYQWIDCATNLPISGETNQSYTATANGSYASIITVGSCSDTTACVLITGLGVAQLNGAAFAVYPNPTTGAFIVESSTDANVTLVNALGDVVMSARINSGKNNMNTGEIARGVYMVKITDLSGHLIQTQRLTVTR